MKISYLLLSCIICMINTYAETINFSNLSDLSNLRRDPSGSMNGSLTYSEFHNYILSDYILADKHGFFLEIKDFQNISNSNLKFYEHTNTKQLIASMSVRLFIYSKSGKEEVDSLCINLNTGEIIKNISNLLANGILRPLSSPYKKKFYKNHSNEVITGSSYTSYIKTLKYNHNNTIMSLEFVIINNNDLIY